MTTDQDPHPVHKWARDNPDKLQRLRAHARREHDETPDPKCLACRKLSAHQNCFPARFRDRP